MFLSRIEIPWERARNPYELHRQIWKLFPGEERERRSSDQEQRQGFLFRIEDYRKGQPVRLLVQSRRSPQEISNLVVLGTRELNPRPYEGQKLAFILTANPVKTIRDEYLKVKPRKISQKCRVPLIREEEQRKWLLQKLSKAGEIAITKVLPHPPLFFRKGNSIGKLGTTTFEGTVQVLDPKVLTLLLENGIGPAKAFGCGLMLVRRI